MSSVLITGGASGIGRATAERFAREGWQVGLLDRDSMGLERASREIGAVYHCACDVTDAAGVQAAIDAFAQQHGLDLLLISHGVLTMGNFEQLTLEQHRRTVEINVIGNLNVLYAAFPHLKQRPGAQVISLCSASAVYGTPAFSSYSATKFAVRALTEALDVEWAKYGIRVSDVMPPFVATPMVTAQAIQPAILARLGVNLAATDVAEAIWRQAQGGPLHRPVGWRFWCQYQLLRRLPDFVQRVLYRLFSV